MGQTLSTQCVVRQGGSLCWQRTTAIATNASGQRFEVCATHAALLSGSMGWTVRPLRSAENSYLRENS